MNVATIGNPDDNLLIHDDNKLKECSKEDRAKTGTPHLPLTMETVFGLSQIRGRRIRYKKYSEPK